MPPGDTVTVAFDGAVLRTGQVDREDATWISVDFPDVRVHRPRTDEGLSWIRGAHTADSVQGRALLAAWGLTW